MKNIIKVTPEQLEKDLAILTLKQLSIGAINVETERR
jgi:hypothetical protein